MVLAVRKMIDLPHDEEEKLSRFCHAFSLRKGELFVREDEIPDRIGFVCQGLFRYYYLDRNGNEFTKGFFPENTILSAYSAMVQNRGSYFSIEALEDSTLVVIRYADWLRLQEGHRCWDKFLVQMIGKGFIKKESREREFLLFDAEERYRLFRQEYPGLERRVKQHAIASYLGITSVALSRIRKKMGLINIG
jgi:CRP-like cAMP-binding protein